MFKWFRDKIKIIEKRRRAKKLPVWFRRTLTLEPSNEVK